MGQGKGKEEVTDRYSLRGMVFHRLRDDILGGKYADGEELKEAALGEELGVSRTPVREALRQLELEGLVSIVPNRGAYVTAITGKDIADIYAIRGLLEGLCARWAVEHIRPEELDAMEENIYISRFHAEKQHAKQLTELDDDFHDILYRACRSKMLEQNLREFHEYVKRIRRENLSDSQRGMEAVEEHGRIMEAIRAKDADRAEELATLHMKNAYANMVESGLLKAYEGNGE